jgi:glycine/D-amino acid oxidase-like deaminating enzyme
LSDAELEAQGVRTDLPAADTRGLLFYVRLLPDRRFMFGARGGLDASPDAAGRQRAWMERRLVQMFPAWRDVEVTHYWRGLVCLSAALTPHVAALDDERTTFCALAYHGSGVAMSTWSGRAVAALSIGAAAAREAIPAVIARQPRRYPLPALRLLWLRLAYAGFQLKDAWV